MADNTNGNGKSRDMIIKILWSALMITAGALAGAYSRGGVTEKEILHLVEHQEKVHANIDAVHMDTEVRMRRVEEAVVYIRTLLEERSNGNKLESKN